MSLLSSFFSSIGRSIVPERPSLLTGTVARSLALPPHIEEADAADVAIVRGKGWIDDLEKAGDPYSAGVARSLVSSLEGRDNELSRLLLTAMRTMAPPRRGDRALLGAYRYMPHLRSVVGRVASSCAAVPWRVYKVPRDRAGNGAKSIVTGHAPDYVAHVDRLKMVKSLVDAGELKEAPNHMLARLLRKPNPEMTSYQLRKLSYVHREIVGERIFIIERNEAGIPVELWPVPPHWVQAIPRPGFDFYDIQSRSGGRAFVKAADVWYMRDLDAESPYERGAGIGRAVSDELDVDEFAAKHMRGWFANHAVPAYLIGVGNSELDDGSDGDAGDDVVERASLKWREQNKGMGRNNRVQFHNGTLTAIRLDDSFKDMAIVDVRKYEAQITRETWNVPPEVLGHVENSNLATIEEAINILAMLVVTPRLEDEQAEINENLAMQFPDGDRVIAVYDNPVRPNMKLITDMSKVAPSVPSVNDTRRWMSLAPLAGGDDIHVVNGRFEKWDPNGSPPLTTPAPGTPTKPGAPVADDEDLDKKSKSSDAAGRRLPLNPAHNRPQSKAFTADEVDELVSKVVSTILVEETTGTMTEVVTDFGTKSLRDVGLAASFSIYDPLVVDALAQYATDRVKGINETTREQLRIELIKGVDAGEGIGPLSARVRGVFDEAVIVRSATIARTEVGHAASLARWAGWMQAGEDVVPFKRWITTMDGRERHAHATINRQLQKLSSPFVCEGSKAQHPGGFGKADLDINCRCAAIPVLDFNAAEQETKTLTPDEEQALWVAYDRALAVWEGKVAELWRVAFARQQAAVLSSLIRLAA